MFFVAFHFLAGLSTDEQLFCVTEAVICSPILLRVVVFLALALKQEMIFMWPTMCV